MTKEFEIQVDVTMSGSIYVEANSEQEAKEKANKILSNITHSDLHSFSCINKKIIDIWEGGDI